MAVAINKWKYKIPYLRYFGGVTALSKEQMERSNGFSNSFYGWGGEDDDLYRRVVLGENFTVFRYPANIARFSMLKHTTVRVLIICILINLVCLSVRPFDWIMDKHLYLI